MRNKSGCIRETVALRPQSCRIDLLACKSFKETTTNAPDKKVRAGIREMVAIPEEKPLFAGCRACFRITELHLGIDGQNRRKRLDDRIDQAICFLEFFLHIRE